MEGGRKLRGIELQNRGQEAGERRKTRLHPKTLVD